MRYELPRSYRRQTAFVCLLAVLCIGTASAEPPYTSFIFPAGGQRGTTVDVRVGGCYLHEEAPFHLTGDGVSASSTIHRAAKTVWFEGPLVYPPESSRAEDYPKDYLGKITIDADAAPGARYWRASTSQGVTAARKFIVGDLPEVVENEIDGEPLPVEVQLPVTINGRIFPRRDHDVWTFHADAGSRITCSVAAASLGSPLDARLEIRDPQGKMIAESGGRFSPDPQLSFEAAEAGLYEVRIHDTAFAGLQDQVYRLTITDGPWLAHAFPLGGRRGETLSAQLAGQNLSTNHANLTVPSDAKSIFELPLSYDGRVSPVVLETGDHPEVIESEPNDSPQQAELVAAPITLNGRIESPGDRDVWALEMHKDEVLQFDVHAAALGSPLDSLLVIRSEAGDELARNDDASSGQPDAKLNYKAKADGRVFVEVSDRFAARGGAAFAYRLHVTPPTPAGFAITLASDALNVDRGGQLKLQLELTAEPGFNRPFKIVVEGLPEGVTAAEVEVKKFNRRANLTIDAAADAQLDSAPVRIVGVTTDGEPEFSTIAHVSTPPGEAPHDETLLAVAEPTPYTFSAEYAYSFVARGGVHYKRFNIERNGFQGPLEVELADRQFRHLQGVTGGKLHVPADADSFDYPIYLPPWMELGRTSRTTLMATGVVTGPKGKPHRVVFTSGLSSEQIICRVSPARLQISAPKALEVRPGGEAVIPVTLNRDGELRGAARIELLVPSHVLGVEAAPIVLPENEQQAVISVRFSDSPGPLNLPFVLRATSGEGDKRIVGETEIDLFQAE